jgi:hypothetical protein
MNQKLMIHAVQAREILDSRGAPTVEDLTLGAVPLVAPRYPPASAPGEGARRRNGL